MTTPTETDLFLHGVHLTIRYDAEFWDGQMSAYVTHVELSGDDCGSDVWPLLSDDARRLVNGHCLRDAEQRRAEGLAHAAEGDALDRYEERRIA